MAGRPDPQTLKREAMLALAEARTSLQRDIHVVRERWNPGTVLQQSVKKHRLAIVAGAGLAGLAAIKFLMPSRENRRDTSAKSAKTRTLFSIVLAALWGMARQPLMGYASRELLPLAMQYISQFQSPSKPTRPQ